MIDLTLYVVYIHPLHIYINKKGYGCKWTCETIQHYTNTQIKVKE